MMRSRSRGVPDWAVYVVAGAAILGLALGISALAAWCAMHFWNWLLPPLFGLPEIGFWQMWGLMWLLSILSGCFRIVVRKS